MNRLHVIGRKNHGKTTLVVALLKQIAAQGLRVAAIKHTHHSHQLDVPGKDSYKFGAAGAAAVGILSREQNALFWPTDGQSPADYDSFAPLLADCDLVLVEGDAQTDAKKIEVWRAEIGAAPLAAADPSIFAVVTDDPCKVPCPLWPRQPIEPLAQRVLELAEL